ncbi:hypothetical protein KAR52_01330 [Candidatus Pacearchaeota archaeon]|nr:hypothetical protein [Candidatus Pacearchaeota archaeon]
MSIAGIASVTGYCHNLIRRTMDAGKERPEKKEIRIEKILEDEQKKVQPIYNTKGQIIEYDKYGRHLDVYV